MSVSGVMDAWNKPYTVFDFETLKDEPLIELDTIGLKGSPTNVYKSFTPPQKGVGVMLEGDSKTVSKNLADMLSAKHVL